MSGDPKRTIQEIIITAIIEYKHKGENDTHFDIACAHADYIIGALDRFGYVIKPRETG
jgi:hypothetical protein